MRAGASGPPSPGAGAAPGAGGASSAGGEVLRRLKETQTLLVKFSEENGRLARENDRLRAGRNALSTGARMRVCARACAHCPLVWPGLAHRSFTHQPHALAAECLRP